MTIFKKGRISGFFPDFLTCWKPCWGDNISSTTTLTWTFPLYDATGNWCMGTILQYTCATKSFFSGWIKPIFTCFSQASSHSMDRNLIVLFKRSYLYFVFSSLRSSLNVWSKQRLIRGI